MRSARPIVVMARARLAQSTYRQPDIPADPCPCAACRRPVPPAEATLARQAHGGEVLCARCRTRRRYPEAR